MNNAVSSHRTRALVDQYDISQFITKVSPVPSQDMSDCTTLIDEHRSYIPVLKKGELALEGLYRTKAIAGATLDDIFGVLPTTALIFSGFPEGRAVGKPAYLILSDVTRYQLDSVVGDLVKCQISVVAHHRAVERGVSLHDLVAETATANGTAVDNGAASTNGGLAVLHVTEILGAAPSVTIKIQASTNGTTWADLQAFTVVTAATKERIEIASGTTINQFLRAVVTFGGTTTSVTYNVSFARR